MSFCCFLWREEVEGGKWLERGRGALVLGLFEVGIDELSLLPLRAGFGFDVVAAAGGDGAAVGVGADNAPSNFGKLGTSSPPNLAANSLLASGSLLKSAPGLTTYTLPVCIGDMARATRSLISSVASAVMSSKLREAERRAWI